MPKGDHLCPRFLGHAQVEYFSGGVLEGLCPGYIEMAGRPAWAAVALLLHEWHRQAKDKSSRSLGGEERKVCCLFHSTGEKERLASQTQQQGLFCCLSAEELLRVVMTWPDLPWPCVWCLPAGPHSQLLLLPATSSCHYWACLYQAHVTSNLLHAGKQDDPVSASY